MTVTIITDHASIHALDSSGVEQDQDVGNPPYRAQDLTVVYNGGIQRVEIRGSQLAIVRVCWECEGDVAPNPQLKRGDANVDGTLNLADAVKILNGLFLSSPLPCHDAADSNDDGSLNLADAIHVLNHIFLSGPPPAPPGSQTCGVDPTPDALGCLGYNLCP